MFQQEWDELNALTKIDLIGKEYFERTGRFLSEKEINATMIRQLLEAGELDGYINCDTERRDVLVIAANNILNQETPFFPPDTDVSVRKVMRYLSGFHHTHHYFEIQCILTGTAEYSTPASRIPVKQHDLIFVPPDTVHSICAAPGGTVICIGIRKSTFEKAFYEIISSSLPIAHYFRSAMAGKQNNEIFFMGALDDLALQLLLMMYRQQKATNSVANKINDHLIQSFIYYIAEKSTDDTIFGTAEYLQEKIWDIRQYIVDHYQTVTLTSTAEHFHYSGSYLSRSICEKLGMSFSQLLQTIRLAKACDFLLNTNIKITQICSQVGYSNESYFIQLFRKRYGVTPLQYRKNGKRQ